MQGTSSHRGTVSFLRQCFVSKGGEGTYAGVVDRAVLDRGKLNVFGTEVVTYSCTQEVSNKHTITSSEEDGPLNPTVEPALTVAVPVWPGVACMSSS